MSEVTEKIKERLGIVDVIGSYIKVEKAGINYKARCPFHNEKTPSFFLSPPRNTFYCFGCGEKGDIFTFVEQFEGVDFKGALNVLASRSGVQIVHEDKGKREERETAFLILEKATTFFEHQLEVGETGKQYLIERGLTPETIKSFQIGYAPKEWRALHDHLTNQGFKEVDIERVGLIKTPDRDETKESNGDEKDTDGGRYYDRFRSRIMFPLSDSTGRVVGFSGRIFPDEEGVAKYVNSPETSLYNKSQILFGLDKAKLAIRKFTFSIVVEGQMDLVMSHQIGFPNTVALSGTALTEHQIEGLHRLTKNIVFAYDSDSAGIASTGRSAELALGLGMDVKIADIPKGSDPADLAQKGEEHLKRAIRNSKHIVDFYMDLLAKEEKDPRALGRKVEEQVIPFVAKIQSKIDQAHFVNKIARALGVGEEVIWGEVEKKTSSPYEASREGTKVEAPKRQETFTRKETILRQLLGIILWQEALPKSTVDVDDLKSSVKKIIGEEHFDKLLEDTGQAREEVTFMAEIGYEDQEAFTKDIEELIFGLKTETLKDEYATLIRELRLAEGEGDEEKVKEKIEACRKISDELQQLENVGT